MPDDVMQSPPANPEVSHEDPATAAALEAKAAEPTQITGASEPGFVASSFLDSIMHPQDGVDQIHGLLDSLNASVGPTDVMRVLEIRNILNHLGARRSNG